VYTRETNKPSVSYTRRDFRFSSVLSRNTVSPCLRFAVQTIFQHERYYAITTTTTMKTETTTPLPEKIAFVSIIARTRDVFSEVDRNKPPACRDANRKCRRFQGTTAKRVVTTTQNCTAHLLQYVV